MVVHANTLVLFSLPDLNVNLSPFNVQFFNTEPYACEPSSLPQYPPSKEIDARRRDDEARRFQLLLIFHLPALILGLGYFISLRV